MAKEKAGEKPEGLVPQEHGGAIYQGPPENPVAGPGRPPSAIRRALRKSFDERIAVLEGIADGDHDAKASDRIAALKEMARIGFGPQVSTEDVRERLGESLDVIQREAEDDVAERIIRRLRDIWRDR